MKISNILKKIIAKDGPHEYCCAMVEIPELENKVQKWQKANIVNNMLAEDGLEIDTHVTLFWGLHDTYINQLKEIFNDFGKNIEISLGKMSLFNSDDHDVLKVDVDSPDLNKLHKIIENKLPNTKSFKDYHPHLTIGYFKKGVVDKFIGDKTFDGIRITKDKFVIADKDGNQTNINLRPNS